MDCPHVHKAASDPAIAVRLLPLGLAQEGAPASRVSAEIRREYDTGADLTSRLPPRKP